MSAYRSKQWCSKGGGSNFKRKFQGGMGRRPTTTVGVRNTRVPELSRGFVCVILRLAVLIQYRRVTHTHTQTDTPTANTRP